MTAHSSIGDRVFPTDELSKRQRVERTLRLEPVDRAALHEQLSYNTAVVNHYSGRNYPPFGYGVDDICAVIRATMDMCFPPVAPCGTGQDVTKDGFVIARDQWHRAIVSRPFADEQGAARWLDEHTRQNQARQIDPDRARADYRRQMLSLQQKIGETVILDYSFTQFCWVYERMGIELFSFFCLDHPQSMLDFMETATDLEVQRIHAVADPALSPVILIPEDFATKTGLIFGPDFLRQFHYPFVRRLVEAWHRRGMCVLYHSDGNYQAALPELMACGVDGFYCLEPACGMDIVALAATWPTMVWAGGVDGVDLMEKGTPEQVRREVRRQIEATRALERGGIFVASSSEINPPIPAENFRAMVEAVGSIRRSIQREDRT